MNIISGSDASGILQNNGVIENALINGDVKLSWFQTYDKIVIRNSIVLGRIDLEYVEVKHLDLTGTTVAVMFLYNCSGIQSVSLNENSRMLAIIVDRRKDDLDRGDGYKELASGWTAMSSGGLAVYHHHKQCIERPVH